MPLLKWRYAVAVAVAAYAFKWVFSGFLDSSRSIFVFGVIVLYTSAGLWLRFHGGAKS